MLSSFHVPLHMDLQNEEGCYPEISGSMSGCVQHTHKPQVIYTYYIIYNLSWFYNWKWLNTSGKQRNLKSREWFDVDCCFNFSDFIILLYFLIFVCIMCCLIYFIIVFMTIIKLFIIIFLFAFLLVRLLHLLKKKKSILKALGTLKPLLIIVGIF